MKPKYYINNQDLLKSYQESIRLSNPSKELLEFFEFISKNICDTIKFPSNHFRKNYYIQGIINLIQKWKQREVHIHNHPEKIYSFLVETCKSGMSKNAPSLLKREKIISQRKLRIREVINNN